MKKILVLILILVATLLSFSGCSKVEYVYVKPECPKLQVIDTNITVPSFNLHYKIKEKNGTKTYDKR